MPYISNNSSGFTEQTDMVQANNSRLAYQAQSDCLDLQKKEAQGYQRLYFTQQLKELMIRCRAQEEMQNIRVYRDAAGQLMVAITDPDDKIIVGRRLLNVTGYKSRVLYSTYIKKASALELTFSWGQKQAKLYFPLAKSESFLRFLKRRGISLLVTGRTEKRAADALLQYTIATSELQEAPYTRGWWRTEQGEWLFNGEKEDTLQEVNET